MDKTLFKIAVLSLALSFTAGNIFPVYAQRPLTGKNNGEETGADSTAETKIDRMKDKADQEIDRRIKSLNAFQERFQSAKKVSEATKSSLSATIQNQIQTLTQLQIKIENGTEIEAVRGDVQSISKTYHIYSLVIPQSAVAASADKILTIADSMAELSAKLESRISEAKSSGKDTASMETSLENMNSKIADAKTQAQNAINGITGLVPDGGDQAKKQSNLAALKDAKSKIQTARQDLVDARKNAKDIVQVLRDSDDERVAETDSDTQPEYKTYASEENKISFSYPADFTLEESTREKYPNGKSWNRILLSRELNSKETAIVVEKNVDGYGPIFGDKYYTLETKEDGSIKIKSEQTAEPSENNTDQRLIIVATMPDSADDQQYYFRLESEDESAETEELFKKLLLSVKITK